MRISHLKCTRLAGLASAILIATTAANIAQAQQRVPCGDRTAIMDHLKDGYAETVVAMGLDAQGRVLEVMAADGGTWTMLVTSPGGLTCLIASGVAWEQIKLPEPEGPVS